MKRISVSVAVPFAVLIGLFPVSAQAQAKNEEAASTGTLVSDSKFYYSDYLAQYGLASGDTPDIRQEDARDADGTPADLQEVGMRKAAILDSGHLSGDWFFTVAQEGMYTVTVDYYPLPGKAKDIEIGFLLNDEIPFYESGSFTLPRIWKNEIPSGESVRRDAAGNDLRPKQVEAPRWVSKLLSGNEGFYDDAFTWYLPAGTHRITLQYARERVAIGAVTLRAAEALPTYGEMRKQYEDSGYEAAPAYSKIYETEKTYEKSSSMLYPTSDRTTPATQPSHYSCVRLNTIGALNWKYQGQWISWETEVPEDGLYAISFKARQNILEGLNSYRTLYVDGKIPFKEARNIKIGYSLHWQTITLGGEEPMLVYLTAGEKHILTLECTPGPVAGVLKDLNRCVLDLNNLYRKIIMVTGTSPDIYRSYYLEDNIPGLREDMKTVTRRLEALSAQYKQITGKGGSQASIIDQMVFALISMVNKPDEIPERLDYLKTNIESLGALTLTLAQQPLELDYLVISSQTELPSPKAGFFENAVYHTKAFFASFVEDYNSIGSVYGKDALDVWVSGSRDQAQIIKSLIDDVFTPDYGTKINLSLVSMNTGTSQSPLVQATLAGQGPDIAMLTLKDVPINLAMRGALADLSAFEGFGEIEQRFYPSAWIPYRYKDGVYAVPETQNFDMMFYRTDIFADLGLTPPQTWDEFYVVLSALHKNNLQVGILETNSPIGTNTQNVGISAGIAAFDKFLYQNGGTYYNTDHSKTAFSEQVAYEAFKEWTELYTKYGLDRQFDFFNRFRTGEMPLGIQPYTMYNQLYHAAPELKGLWAFVPVPGTRREDGAIDRSETADGNASVMLKSCENKENAFRFLHWWTSSHTQARYGNELELIMGPAARYNTANIEAFRSLSWTESERQVLEEQWKSVTDTPQIPGNYFMTRSLTSAFRAVVDEKYNPVYILNAYNKDMNAEIARKRKEFGIEQRR